MTEHNTADRDQGDWGADPELRAMLSAGDPVRSLPPLTSSVVERLVNETILAAESGAGLVVIGHPVADQRVAGRRGSRVPLLVAAAVVIVAGVGGFAALDNGDDVVPTAVKPPAAVTSAPAAAAPSAAETPTTPNPPTVLQVADVGTLKCMVPNVEILKLQQIAFEGTVSAIDGSTITLGTTKIYTGEVADTVQIQAPSSEMSQLLSAVSFESGKSYLVSATDGQVTLCGFSAEATPDLQALYEQAFAG